ncbi:MAG: MBL fold metallo-hydrolase [Chloroflexota bacterium]
MKIKYLAHACFRITSDSGVTIITDPYTPNDMLKYGAINESADIVLVTHEHGDHNNVAGVLGKPTVVKSSATVKGLELKGIPLFHDEEDGKQRGKDTVFCFTLDGVRLCHLGDLGHTLTAAQAAEIGAVDVLFLPVGGYFTIDAAAATRVAESLKPRVVIPMHFKTEKCGYPIAPVEDFLKGKKDVARLNTSEAEVKKDKLPAATQVWVLPMSR